MYSLQIAVSAKWQFGRGIRDGRPEGDSLVPSTTTFEIVDPDMMMALPAEKESNLT
jgi:hypothetical protein